MAAYNGQYVYTCGRKIERITLLALNKKHLLTLNLIYDNILSTVNVTRA